MTRCVLLQQDEVLAVLLQTCKDQIVSYHEHQSLLDHKQEEELSAAEREAAWAEYQAEVRRSSPVISTFLFGSQTASCSCV